MPKYTKKDGRVWKIKVKSQLAEDLLPPEIWLHVFSFLEPLYLVVLRSVCCLWRFFISPPRSRVLTVGPLEFFAKRGYLSLLRWSRTSGLPWEGNLYKWAALAGDRPCLEWMLREKLAPIRRVLGYLAQGGHLSLLQEFYQRYGKKKLPNAFVFTKAAKGGDKNTCSWLFKTFPHSLPLDQVCYYAAKFGHTDLLDILLPPSDSHQWNMFFRTISGIFHLSDKRVKHEHKCAVLEWWYKRWNSASESVAPPPLAPAIVHSQHLNLYQILPEIIQGISLWDFPTWFKAVGRSKNVELIRFFLRNFEYRISDDYVRAEPLIYQIAKNDLQDLISEIAGEPYFSMLPALKGAACGGHLDFFLRLLEMERFDDPISMCSWITSSVKHGHTTIFWHFYDHGFFSRAKNDGSHHAQFKHVTLKNCHNLFIANGMFDQARSLQKRSNLTFKLSAELAEKFYTKNNFNLIYWAMGRNLNLQFLMDQRGLHYLIAMAAKFGKLDILQYVKAQNVIREELTFRLQAVYIPKLSVIASYYGHVHILQWLEPHIPPYHFESCLVHAKRGYQDHVVAWLERHWPSHIPTQADLIPAGTKKKKHKKFHLQRHQILQVAHMKPKH